MTARPDEAQASLRAELVDARRKLENVQAAILEGARGPTTAAMLQEWEEKVAKLEAALAVNARGKGKIILHPSAVRKHLQDLKGTLGRDPDLGRTILSRLVGKIILRPEGSRLVAEITANVPGLLDLEGEQFGSNGAGRGI